MNVSKIKTRVFATISIAFFCAMSFAAPKTEEANWPRDVTRYIQGRELCDHFRGEAGDMSDDTRENEIANGLENCKGTDADLASLKSRHAKSFEVMAKLRRYDILVEGNQRGLPKDVWSYLTARVQCDESLAVRMRESSLIDSTSNLSLRDRACRRANDRLLTNLKSKHAKNRVVMEALGEFAPLKSRFQPQRH